MKKQVYLRRNRARHARRQSASFDGALSTWRNSVVSRREADRQLEISAERALDLYHNDAMGHGVIESLVVEAVGIGLTPQPDPRTDWLGFGSEWETKFQAEALRVWEEWGLDCRHWCDASRRMNFYGLQNLAYFQWKLLGVGVFQVIAKPRPNSPFSLSLLPIDPFRLLTPSDKTNEEIYDGVEIDKEGEAKAVWIRKPGALSLRPCASDCERFEVYDSKTGLPKILLVTDVRNVAEYRQDSILGPMISEIRHSNDLAEASVVGALVRNLFTVFIQDFGQGHVNQDTPWQNRVFELEKGTVLTGSSKEKPTFFSPEAAPSRYGEMFEAIIDRMGMSTGRGAENILRKFQASYSASKASLEKADQYNQTEHRIVIDQLCQPSFSWLMYEASLKNRIPVKHTDLVKDLYAYTHCDFLAQPMRQIDREKAAKASVLELQTGISTYQEILGRNGQNWRKVLEQRFKEAKQIEEFKKKYGVSPEFSQGLTVADSTQDESTQDESMQENDSEAENEE